MNFKQQKRIKDTALMLRNVMSMSKNMTTINMNYASDLESFISKLKNISKKSEAPASDLNSSIDEATSLILPSEKKAEKKEEKTKASEDSQPNNQLKRPPKTKRPPAGWAKDLYRKIMMKCHPDRNQSPDIDVMEQVYRAEALAIAGEAYREERFDDLVYAGALVDIYSSRLSANKQMKILNDSYTVKSQSVSEIQGSISWCWGINWDGTETRIGLIKRICRLNNIPVPPKEELAQLLSDHEMK